MWFQLGNLRCNGYALTAIPPACIASIVGDGGWSTAGSVEMPIDRSRATERSHKRTRNMLEPDQWDTASQVAPGARSTATPKRISSNARFAANTSAFGDPHQLPKPN